MGKETKADLIEDKCTRCGGTGVDPEQRPKPTPSGEVSADKCRQCGGSGRMPKGK
jgi:DnaJ-class molecular chaperone